MEEIIKNQPILNKIFDNIIKGKLFSQAYLISGNDKKQLEYISILFSKILLCNKKYRKNCNDCNICKQIESGNYNELIRIIPENGVIKKDEIISLRKRFKTESIVGKYQVYIINDVDLLNQSAANSLLKFLEEPESSNIAIFTTTNLSSVINTIISRCQIIKLNESLDEKNIVKEISGFEESDIKLITTYFLDIENKKNEAFLNLKDNILKKYNTKDMIKSLLYVLLLLYKDLLNYKLFGKFYYFENENCLADIAVKKDNIYIIKKMTLILNYLKRIKYNVNITLFMTSLLIELNEIEKKGIENNGKSSRN